MANSTDGAMTDNCAVFDLPREIADWEQKKPWAAGIHSRMLFKKPGLRTVLILMEKGARMKEHHADGAISIQPVKGRICVNAEAQIRELETGHLLTLNASIKHDIEALDDSAFLLTIAWPNEQDLRALEHRGYGS